MSEGDRQFRVSVCLCLCRLIRTAENMPCFVHKQQALKAFLKPIVLEMWVSEHEETSNGMNSSIA